MKYENKQILITWASASRIGHVHKMSLNRKPRAIKSNNKHQRFSPPNVVGETFINILISYSQLE